MDRSFFEKEHRSLGHKRYVQKNKLNFIVVIIVAGVLAGLESAGELRFELRPKE